MGKWMTKEEQVRHAFTGEPSNPTVTILAGGEHIDISYACTFNHDTHKVVLPDNLPGGSEVYVDGVHIHTTPIELADREKYVGQTSRGRFARNLLAAAIGDILTSPHYGYQDDNARQHLDRAGAVGDVLSHRADLQPVAAVDA